MSKYPPHLVPVTVMGAPGDYLITKTESGLFVAEERSSPLHLSDGSNGGPPKDFILESAPSTLKRDIQTAVTDFLPAPTFAVLVADGAYPEVESAYQNSKPNAEMPDWKAFMARNIPYFESAIEEHPILYRLVAEKILVDLYDYISAGAIAVKATMLALEKAWGEFLRSVSIQSLKQIEEEGTAEEKAYGTCIRLGLGPPYQSLRAKFVHAAVLNAMMVGRKFNECQPPHEMERAELEFLCGMSADSGLYKAHYLQRIAGICDKEEIGRFCKTELKTLPRLAPTQTRNGRKGFVTKGWGVKADPMWPLAAEVAALDWDRVKEARDPHRFIADEARRKGYRHVLDDLGAFGSKFVRKYDALNRNIKRGADYSLDEAEWGNVAGHPKRDTRPDPTNELMGTEEDRAPMPYWLRNRIGVLYLSEPRKSELTKVRPSYPSQDELREARRFEKDQGFHAAGKVIRGVDTESKVYTATISEELRAAILAEFAKSNMKLNPDAAVYFPLKMGGFSRREIVQKTGWSENQAANAQEAVRLKTKKVIKELAQNSNCAPERGLVEGEKNKNDLPTRPPPVRNGVYRERLDRGAGAAAAKVGYSNTTQQHQSGRPKSQRCRCTHPTSGLAGASLKSSGVYRIGLSATTHGSSRVVVRLMAF